MLPICGLGKEDKTTVY